MTCPVHGEQTAENAQPFVILEDGGSNQGLLITECPTCLQPIKVLLTLKIVAQMPAFKVDRWVPAWEWPSDMTPIIEELMAEREIRASREAIRC